MGTENFKHKEITEHSSLSLSPFLSLSASSHNEGLTIGIVEYWKDGIMDYEKLLLK